MNKPVIGVTVGTPISPKKIEKEIKPVKTVNGVEPDENGNVEVEGGGGNANFIFANSKEELPDPSTVPEDTVALVPSEDDGGESGDISELEQRVAEIERDHTDNTNFVMRMTGLAKNPENDGKVYGIKDEQIVAMDAPTGSGLPPVTEADNGKVLTANAANGTAEWKEPTGGTKILVFNSLEEVPTDLPEGTIVLVPIDGEDEGGDAVSVIAFNAESNYSKETIGNLYQAAKISDLDLDIVDFEGATIHVEFEFGGIAPIQQTPVDIPITKVEGDYAHIEGMTSTYATIGISPDGYTAGVYLSFAAIKDHLDVHEGYAPTADIWITGGEIRLA